MGGKVWSEDEERIFWEVVVPRSPASANPATRELNWDQCVDLMTERIGDGARRGYTPTLLYEHHYQYLKSSTKSSTKARPFVEKFLRDKEWYRTHSSPPPPTPPRSPALDDPLLAALLGEETKPKSRRIPKKPRKRKGQAKSLSPTKNGTRGQSQSRDATEAPRSRSFTPVNQYQPLHPPTYRLSAHGEALDVDQRNHVQTFAASSIPRAGVFLERDPAPVEKGHWHHVPQARYDEGQPHEPTMSRTPLPSAPRTYHPACEVVSSERLVRQAPSETEAKWNGSLPSIHEMFPSMELRRETYANDPSDNGPRHGKRIITAGPEHEPAPKRQQLAVDTSPRPTYGLRPTHRPDVHGGGAY